MDSLFEIWSSLAILFAAFLIGWAAEAAQTFIPRALAFSLLAWLQTLPEFAVEASIAWNQKTDLMIANLTGSLRILVGLGWPLVFFVQYFMTKKKGGGVGKREIVLPDSDFSAPFFLFVSVLYFLVILFKKSLNCYDAVVLVGIYLWYLRFCLVNFETEEEELEDMPWIVQKVVLLPKQWKITVVVFSFIVGGLILHYSVEPFLHTLERWALAAGISTFVFIQWVAPFLSEFPEKVSSVNWARHPKKAPMAVMNMVSSNINQWTMLAAMIPIVYSLSAGGFRAIELDAMHQSELALTIAQSFLGALLLLDLRFSIFEAGLIFVLWFVQFIFSSFREPITYIYLTWSIVEIAKMALEFGKSRKIPRVISVYYRWKRERAA